ncbi:hypothetical protein [Levilactobacillus huananensis]|uniref:hypothetical protein n=1 Tax=Levilactobacillus huananensis TaxID=2486019 RepID=UPI000F7B15C7|nr:hypothetical protein [Levilactobacillus huananensis]
MRLNDFNLSTIDLHPALTLYWEQADRNLPVCDLQTRDHNLFLITGKGRPLTLDQFRTRTQQVAPNVGLFVQATPPTRLYGYRLVPHQILFG